MEWPANKKQDFGWTSDVLGNRAAGKSKAFLEWKLLVPGFARGLRFAVFLARKGFISL